MGVDQRQDTVLADLAECIAAHIAHFLFVNHPEAAIDKRFFDARLLNGDFSIHQQTHFFQLLDKLTCPLACLLKLFAETQDALCGFGGLVVVEQGLAFFKLGSAPVDDGLSVLLVSHDSALIRLTPNPLYERSGLAMFDTSIMGTLQLESWLHTPLALSLYQAPTSGKGKGIDVVLGDEANEPVFTIPDLLPHLSRKVQRKKLIDSPERLDVVAGFSAKALRTTLTKVGLTGDLLSGLEATLVPAGAATYVGVDKGLIAGANHASRAVPFGAMQALLKGEVTKSVLVIVMGRDQQSYAGAGPEAHISNLVPRAVETLAPGADALRLRRILAKTRVLMFDHSEGARNRGVVLGTRRDDSSPSAFRQAIRLFKAGEVATQHLQTAGWSQAREVASLDIDTVALGLPVTGVGMPYELLSTYDLFHAYRACLAWVAQ